MFGWIVAVLTGHLFAPDRAAFNGQLTESLIQRGQASLGLLPILGGGDLQHTLQHIAKIHVVEIVVEGQIVSLLDGLDQAVPMVKKPLGPAFDDARGRIPAGGDTGEFDQAAGSSLVPPLRVPPEVGLTVIRLEKSPDSAIGIEGDESTLVPIKPGHRSVAPSYLENAAPDRGIPQRLGCSEIVGFGESRKLAAVFLKVLSQLFRGSKADLRSNH